jgi:hypothetical protein
METKYTRYFLSVQFPFIQISKTIESEQNSWKKLSKNQKNIEPECWSYDTKIIIPDSDSNQPETEI